MAWVTLYTVNTPGFWPLSWGLFMLLDIVFKLHKQALFLVMIESWVWAGVFLLNSHYVSIEPVQGKHMEKQRFPVKTHILRCLLVTA